MKLHRSLRGILGLVLCVGLILLVACEADSGGKKEFTVTFATGEGTGTAPASQKIKDGSSVTLPGQGSMVAPTGKSFKGWLINGASYTAGAGYTVIANVTATAEWQTGSSQSGGAYQISVRHLRDGTEIISKITIYKHDSNFTSNNDYRQKGGVVIQTEDVTKKYGESWTDGRITSPDKYVLEVLVGANSYYWVTFDVYSIPGSATFTYSSSGLAKQ